MISKLVVIFFCLSMVNVVFATAKSIATIRCNKYIASLMNAGYFAFYNVVMIYTVAEFPLWQKCIITFVCNLIGVFLVKYIEEKLEKEKLWKIEFTIKNQFADRIIAELKEADAGFHYVEVGKYTTFSIYCESREETSKAHRIIGKYNGKYFVSESKSL